MAGILKVDQIQNTAGVNIMDLQNDEIRVWNGSGYSSMATPGALISIQTFTSQDGTWNSKSTSGGSGTWTKPNNCGHVLVYVTGGGGGNEVPVIQDIPRNPSSEFLISRFGRSAEESSPVSNFL